MRVFENIVTMVIWAAYASVNPQWNYRWLNVADDFLVVVGATLITTLVGDLLTARPTFQIDWCWLPDGQDRYGRLISGHEVGVGRAANGRVYLRATVTFLAEGRVAQGLARRVCKDLALNFRLAPPDGYLSWFDRGPTFATSSRINGGIHLPIAEPLEPTELGWLLVSFDPTMGVESLKVVVEWTRTQAGRSSWRDWFIKVRSGLASVAVR